MSRSISGAVSKSLKKWNATSIEAGQESKNLATLLWVGTLFLGFIPGLVVYLVKKDDPYIQDQAKEALNWSITAGCAYVLALFLMIIVIGAFLVPVIGGLGIFR